MIRWKFQSRGAGAGGTAGGEAHRRASAPRFSYKREYSQQRTPANEAPTSHGPAA